MLNYGTLCDNKRLLWLRVTRKAIWVDFQRPGQHGDLRNKLESRPTFDLLASRLVGITAGGGILGVPIAAVVVGRSVGVLVVIATVTMRCSSSARGLDRGEGENVLVRVVVATSTVIALAAAVVVALSSSMSSA
jgi:hypothetical protein